MSYDAWKSTEPHRYGGGNVPRSVAFKYACEGLVAAVRKACEPTESLVEECFREDEAVWFARHVAHEAGRLGLVPPVPLDLRVLVELDVLAGDSELVTK